MKLTSKVVTLVAINMAMVQIVCPARQTIVAYKKGLDQFSQTAYSAIMIIQDGKTVSSAKFETSTAKSGTLFSPEPKTKHLYFEENGGPIRIVFYNVASSMSGVSGGAGVVPTYYPPQTEPALNTMDIPKGSKIKISKGTLVPYKIEIEPVLVRVNVNKIMTTLPGTAKIIALKEKIDGNVKPRPDQIYDTILAKNTSTRKLKVPRGKAFWISVPISPSMAEITPMNAKKDVTTSSVININDYSKAAWGN